MIFKRIKIKNFKVFPRSTEIDLSGLNPNDNKNIFLIGGTNGSGKTAIIEAVKLCLYGRKALGWNAKKLFESINKQERKKNNCELFIEVEFETDDGEKLVIKRKWDTPSSILNPDHNDLEQEALIVEKGGRRSKILNEREWQEFLNSKIPEGVSNFFFFDGEKIQDLAEAKGKRTLRTSIETILGLETLRGLVKDLDKVKRRFRKEDQISDEKYKKEAAERSYLEKQIDEFKERSKELEEEINDLKNDKKNKREEFEDLFGFNPEQKERIKALERKIIRLSNEKTRVEEKIEGYIKDIFPFALLGKFLPSLENQIEEEEKMKRIKALQEEKKKLAKNIVKEIFEDRCPIGNEPVSDNDRKELTREITTVISERGGRPKEENFLLGLSDKQQSVVLSVISEIRKKAGKNLLPLIQRKKKIEGNLTELEQKKDSLRKAADNEKFEELQEDISTLDDTIGARKEELRNIEDQRKRTKEDLKDINKKLEKLGDKLETSRKAKTAINLTKKARDVIEEYIKQLRQQKLAALEENIFSMFRNLATKSELFSEITINRNNYEVSVIDKSNKAIKKSNLSAGEKQIYAISLLWGLARTSRYNLPVIVDTPLGRLDRSHRDNIVEKYFPEAGKQVILFSTDTEVDKNYYEKLEPYIKKTYHLNFDKNREWTTVEEGYFW